MDGIEVAISVNLLGSLAALTPPVVKRVHETIKKLERNPDHSGLDYKPPQNARDRRIRTCRVSDNYRMVCAEAGRNHVGRRTIVALTVQAHDEAYRWAERQVLTIDGVAGAHVVDVVAVEAAADKPWAGATGGVSSSLLGQVKDSVLRFFGVPDDVVPLVRSAVTEVELEGLLALLPGPVADAVRGLAAGLSQDEVWAEVAALYGVDLLTVRRVGPGTSPGGADDAADMAADQGPDDLAAALASGASADRFHVFVDDAALERALQEPLAIWRVFLHPLQSSAIQRRYGGPARVTGGPGTGKSVVAMHRAAHLVRAGQGQVLLTTFTKNLAQQLQSGLRSLLAPEEATRATVMNIDALATSLYARRFGELPDLTSAKVDRLWSRILAKEATDRPPAFFATEWRDVVEQQRVRTLADYLQADRRGRGAPLNPPQRQAVWRIFERFFAGLAEEGLSTFGLMADTTADALDSAVAAGEPHAFRHIIVDEAQDLSAPQWRLLRALAPLGPDDLFIVGDGRQRIYNHGASLRSLGIETRGRSQRLRLSYRSTGEILAWAERVLSGAGIVDLGEDGAAAEALPDVTSLMSGPAPTTMAHPTEDDERQALVAIVSEWLAEGEASLLPHEIAVAVRTTRVRDEIAARLRDAGIPAIALAGDDECEVAVTVATMHRLKGMEYRAVIVADVKDGTVPNDWAVRAAADDELGRQQALLQERSLLYVACTRARERLHVSWSGAPSQFLVGSQEASR